MKRRASNSTPGLEQHEGPRRRRQPQISCNFCRSKKLKCDRGQPCSNCTSRGIPCDGQLVDPPSSTSALGTGPVASPNVLERLRRLEEAVFGASSVAADPSHAHPDPHPDVLPDPHRSIHVHDETPASSSSRLFRDHREPSAEVEYNNTAESLALDDCYTFHFRVSSRSEYSNPRSSPMRCIDMPSREDAHTLFQDYIDNSYFQIANAMHAPYITSSIGRVYAQLRQGHKVDLGSAALILSFCAASAFFWNRTFSAQFDFLSEDNAATQSQIWRGAAWDLLDQAQRSASHSLDSIQARLVLADLLQNSEGITSRFRQLHSCARTSAYELRLHIVDLPGNHSLESPLLREVKRRVWWHLVATDWFLSSLGGAMDRIYTVQPQQMSVNRPSLTPDLDYHTAPSHDLLSETIVLHMNIRIRIAEMSRAIVDALPLGSGDVDTLPYSKIASLDQKYEGILADLPALPTTDFASLDRSKRKIALERSIGIISVNARRAKFLRPLLPIKDMPQRFEAFRKQCLQSTQTVIEIASTVLSDAVDTPKSTSGSNRGSSYHSGLVTMHLFMACAVLATDPSLRGGAERSAPGMDPETERRRSQLANACRLLEKAGEKSPMALEMVTRLVSVLRKHRVHGVEQQQPTTAMTAALPDQSSPYAATATATATASGSREVDLAGQLQTQQMQTTGTAQMAPSLDPSGFPAAPQNWAYDLMDPNGLTGIWNDFLGTNPTNIGWEQLFSELDYMSGGM